MTLLGYIRYLDRKFAWSFLGVLLALLFGGITIQREFFFDSGPRLRYDILTSTPVLDVRENVSKLSILLDGIDIRQQKKSLRVITVRIMNDSQKDILKGHYDDAEPLGLRISTGRVIKSDLVIGSNPYLERQLVPRQYDDTTLVFPSVILEAQEYFVVKLLVLHDEGKQPDITPIGKIAGIRTIPVTDAYKKEASPPFLGQTFAGGVLVQVLRLLAYSVGMFFVLAVIIAPTSFLGGKMSERKKRKIVEEFKQTASLELRDKNEFFFRTYVKGQGFLLLSMLSLISNPKALESSFARHEEHVKRETHLVDARPPLEHYEMNQEEDIWFPWRMTEFLMSGLIKKTDEGLEVDEHVKGILEEFVAFLKKKDLLSERDIFRVAHREFADANGTLHSEKTEETEQETEDDK